MLVDVHFPESLPPQRLDDYLQAGWFRMVQGIFTTNFLKFNNVLYSALWLRIDLREFELSSTQKKLHKQNAGFKVVIQKENLRKEHEKLFQKYKTAISFDTYDNLKNLLYGEHTHSIFDTYEVNIYDKEKLIAAGFFDLGENSSEGISCFYDPAYKKYSLGKYLMLQKMIFCKNKGFSYFYPGYFAPEYPLFDYKLDLGKNTTTYFDVLSKTWKCMRTFDAAQTPIKIIEQKLGQLSEILWEHQQAHELMIYDHFDINMVQNFVGQGLLQSPMMLVCMEFNHSKVGICIYDLFSARYHFLICNYEYQLNFPRELEHHFTKFLLKPVDSLFSEKSALFFSLHLQKYINSLQILLK